jgi:outer membrane protein assembly factor BamB
MSRLVPLILLIAVSGFARAEDWPQWLGPRRDGSSSAKITPWKEAPKVLWRVSVGEGHSSPIIAGGRVFVHVKVKDRDEEELLALDAGTGKEAWHAVYPRGQFTALYGAGPRATPVVAGGRVYTYGITGILTCFDAESGKQLWQKDALKEFRAPNLLFGCACSPIVIGKNVLINVGGKGASIVAFDATAGAVAWKSQDDKASYSSPIRVVEDKVEQVVFLTGKRLLSLDPGRGMVYWDFPLVDQLFESSTTPILAGDLLLASSITYGSVGLKLSTKGGKPAAESAWKDPRLTCYFSTPLVVDKEHAFVVTGANPLLEKPAATLRCIETATGKVLWTKSPVGEYHASLIRTGDGKVLMLDDAGNLALLQPDATHYRELARAKVCGKTWSHGALVDGRLYVRDEKELVCVQLGD